MIPVLFESLLHVREGNVELLGAEHDGLEVVFEEFGDGATCAFGWLGDAIANAGHTLDQSFVAQGDERFLHGVRIDLVLSAESADGGEDIARLQLTGDDRLARGVEHLFVNRHAGLEFDR